MDKVRDYEKERQDAVDHLIRDYFGTKGICSYCQCNLTPDEEIANYNTLLRLGPIGYFCNNCWGIALTTGFDSGHEVIESDKEE